jgi:hypothetical protein
MNMKQIEKKQARSQVPYEVAKQIRALLDESRKSYGATDWDDDELELKIQELVFEEC